MKRHTDALVTLIKQAPSVATKTYVATVPRDADGKPPSGPYAVLWPSDGTDTKERFTGPFTTLWPRFTLHVVSTSYASVSVAVEQIKAVLFPNGRGVLVPVVGEKSFSLTWEVPTGIQVDDDVNPSLVYAVIEIGWRSELLA